VVGGPRGEVCTGEGSGWYLLVRTSRIGNLPTSTCSRDKRRSHRGVDELSGSRALRRKGVETMKR
jgi:hypothetical protein